MPKVIEVIESLEHRGKGTDENPYRIVKRYHTLDGELLAESDPFYEEYLEELKNEQAGV